MIMIVNYGWWRSACVSPRLEVSYRLLCDRVGSAVGAGHHVVRAAHILDLIPDVGDAEAEETRSVVQGAIGDFVDRIAWMRRCWHPSADVQRHRTPANRAENTRKRHKRTIWTGLNGGSMYRTSWIRQPALQSTCRARPCPSIAGVEAFSVPCPSPVVCPRTRGVCHPPSLYSIPRRCARMLCWNRQGSSTSRRCQAWRPGWRRAGSCRRRPRCR
jgi:hypothetical protein